jgi:hypothetical protein
MQPETVITRSVPAELLLVRADAVAVAVGSLRANPNGFEFTVHVRLRREDEAAEAAPAGVAAGSIRRRRCHNGSGSAGLVPEALT